MKAYQQTISEWLHLVGERQGVALSLGSDGHCTVPFGQGGECIIEVPDNDDAQAFYLYIPLLRLPADEPSQLMLTRAALELNMFGLTTGGSQISLDSRTNYLVLSFSALIEMFDETAFMQTLGEFLDLGISLQSQFQVINTQQNGASSALHPLPGSAIVC
ncbi:CesT family type III secretion system chaperone [Photorhabdus antumapuensis]|uniref:CesT family type III secretion system chaperone n=1 Tax=Photorhabdus antumapuensis TaxID=2862867 RepID=UPI001CED6F4C|nr:CesT family type III secretion system chaperone [Photorhabdus antumapuensis]